VSQEIQKKIKYFLEALFEKYFLEKRVQKNFKQKKIKKK